MISLDASYTLTFSHTQYKKINEDLIHTKIKDSWLLR